MALLKFSTKHIYKFARLCWLDSTFIFLFLFPGCEKKIVHPKQRKCCYRSFFLFDIFQKFLFVVIDRFNYNSFHFPLILLARGVNIHSRSRKKYLKETNIGCFSIQNFLAYDCGRLFYIFEFRFYMKIFWSWYLNR